MRSFFLVLAGISFLVFLLVWPGLQATARSGSPHHVPGESSKSPESEPIQLAAKTSAEQKDTSSDTAPESLPTTIRNFRLEDHRGDSHELYRYREARAIVLFFAGNGCPIVQKSIIPLEKIRDDYAPKGVVFLMINGNPGDDREDVVKEAAEFDIDFPILLDQAQIVTQSLRIDRTATTLVVVPQGWKVVYRGAMDDRLDYGAQKPAPTHTWLKDALDAVLSGSPVQVSQTEAKGCLIDLLPEPRKVSYSRHIGPLLKKKCATCHVEGNIAPFPMDGHEEVENRKRMIREVVLTKRMPPWHADPHYGAFANDNSLEPEELRSLVAWLDAGAPRGRGRDPLAKVKPMDTSWPLGEPDMVISLPNPIHVPADGVVDYQYIHVPFTGEEDMWVRAAYVLPGARTVVHHVLVFLKYPERLRGQQPDYDGGLDGFFAGYVPGMQPSFFPKGTAKWVPAGSEFVFQLHYSPNGRAADDLSKLGLYMYKGKPKQELFTRAASNTDFAIPPGNSKYEADAVFRVRRDTLLYSMSPHMHYRGRNFEYVAEYPDGRSEVLLNVPHYDFNWQTMYEFEEPKVLPAGTRIRCVGAFDNSARNPMNPDPSSWVYFGEQTFEEMFIGYLRYSYVPSSEGEESSGGRNREEEVAGLGQPITAENLVGTVWRGARFKLFFRANGDLQVGRSMKGTWVLEGDTVTLHVGADDHVLHIQGDQLVGDRGPLPYLASPDPA